MVTAGLVALFPTLSPCATVTDELPFVSVGAVVYVQLPAVHGTVPPCAPTPVTTTETVGLSPVAVPHVPPREVTAVAVENGKLRGVPLTEVTAAVGATLSTVIDCPGLVPLLPARSSCVAVRMYVPLA